MGTCVSRDFVASQERSNSELSQEVSRIREALQAFQNDLMEPQSREERETLRQMLIVQREITELKELLLLRNEVESLKQSLRMDPSLVVVDVQKEVNQLREQIALTKDAKDLSTSLVNHPPYAALCSVGGNNIANWSVAHCKEGCFDVFGQSILAIKAGLYLIHLEIIYNGSYMSSTTFSLLLNSAPLVTSSQVEGGNTHIFALVPLERESIITVRSTTKFSHVAARLNLIMLKG